MASNIYEGVRYPAVAAAASSADARFKDKVVWVKSYITSTLDIVTKGFPIFACQPVIRFEHIFQQ